jgi:hypothetical protein
MDRANSLRHRIQKIPVSLKYSSATDFIMDKDFLSHANVFIYGGDRFGRSQTQDITRMVFYAKESN